MPRIPRTGWCRRDRGSRRWSIMHERHGHHEAPARSTARRLRPARPHSMRMRMRTARMDRRVQKRTARTATHSPFPPQQACARGRHTNALATSAAALLATGFSAGSCLTLAIVMTVWCSPYSYGSTVMAMQLWQMWLLCWDWDWDWLGLCARGHNYTGHNYIGHKYIGLGLARSLCARP